MGPIRLLLRSAAGLLLPMVRTPTAAGQSPGPFLSGTLTAEYTYDDLQLQPNGSGTGDELSCKAELEFFSNGWMRFHYSFRRVAFQSWSYQGRPYGSTQYREDTRHTTYHTGAIVRVTVPGGADAGDWQLLRRPYTDSIFAGQRIREHPDGSFDLSYRYPSRIPLVKLEEEIHVAWDGNRTVVAPEGFQQATDRCEPFLHIWVQQTALRSTRGALAGLSDSVDRPIPNTTARIKVTWNLQLPSRKP